MSEKERSQKTENQKVCCMFSDPVPGHAVDNQDLETMASEEWSRKDLHIYRCRRCGAYVWYRYEETVSYGGWDNAEIEEFYSPIETPTFDEENGSIAEKVSVIHGARGIYTRYMEEDWTRDRHWEYYNT